MVLILMDVFNPPLNIELVLSATVTQLYTKMFLLGIDLVYFDIILKLFYWSLASGVHIFKTVYKKHETLWHFIYFLYLFPLIPCLYLSDRRNCKGSFSLIYEG